MDCCRQDSGAGDGLAGQGGVAAGIDPCHNFVPTAQAGLGLGEGVWGDVGPSETLTQTWLGS